MEINSEILFICLMLYGFILVIGFALGYYCQIKDGIWFKEIAKDLANKQLHISDTKRIGDKND